LALEALLEEGAEPLINKAMAMALSGDTAALRLCRERILPVRRDRLVRLDLPTIGTAKDISIAMSTIFTAIGQGQITPREGQMMANILGTQTNVFIAEELESRLNFVSVPSGVETNCRPRTPAPNSPEVFKVRSLNSALLESLTEQLGLFPACRLVDERRTEPRN
jgi:hypothetical protein